MYNFLPASPLSIINHVKKSDVSYDIIDKYISDNTPGSLHCVYENISSEKSIYNLNYKVQKSLDILNDKFPNVPIWFDSAGFQISQGKFSSKAISDYINIYYDMLDKVSPYARNFVLDIPPSSAYTTYQEVEKVNDRSYALANERNTGKSIFVFHTHTFELYKVWNKLFDKYNKGFNKFSIGGVAGGLGNDRTVIYSCLFRIFLEKCLETNRKEVDFHILGAGGASGLIMILFRLLQEISKSVYGITLNMTSDSSQHRRIAMSRWFRTIYNHVVYELSWFSKQLHYNFGGTTIEKYILDKLNKFSNENNMGVVTDRLYNNDGKTNMTSYILMCLHDIEIYNRTSKIIDENVSELYQLYLNGDSESFSIKCTELLKRLNGGKLTKNMKKDVNNITKFIDILHDKDLNRCLNILESNNPESFSNSGLLNI